MNGLVILKGVAAVCLTAATLHGIPSGADPAPSGYRLNNTVAPYGFRFTAPGEPVRRGDRAERYELRDGDCGHSDCGAPRFRSEIRMAKNRTRARIGKDIWYGWSFYNENIGSFSWRYNIQNVVGQWKMGGHAAPIFKLVQIGQEEANFESCDPTICTRDRRKHWDVVVQLDDMKEANDWGEAENWGLICRLFSMSGSQGRWVDITVNTNFSAGPDGYLRIWINGELRCDYRGQLVVNKSRRLYPGPNHRRGIYVSFTKRWERERPNQPYPTQIVYYDEFLIGQSREDVDVRMRESADAPPVN